MVVVKNIEHPVYIGPGLFDLLERNIRQLENIKEENVQLRKQLRKISKICRKSYRGRGIHKLIDENRELLSFMYKSSPDIDDEAAFVIETFIYNKDRFFQELAKVLHIKATNKLLHIGCKIDVTGRFPRPWSGRFYNEPTTSSPK